MHKSSKWLFGEVLFVLFVILILGAYHHPLFLPYQWHKLLHIFGAILLLGNIIITAVWMLMAERTKDPGVMRFAAEMVNWADVFFTVPGIFLLITNGDTLSEQWGGILRTGWITVSLGLFAASGFIWIGILLRYQNALIRISQAPRKEELPPEFFQVLHRWYFWGAIATILPCLSLILMFLKPRVW
jgi:uncharacterized membrane protein